MEENRMLSDEILLGLIKKNGGGGGTDDYNDLKNQPKINNKTLTGNKSASDLGLADSDTVDGILDGTDIDSFGDVERALAGKQDMLTFDNAPTANSSNPVKSGGVYSALADKQDALTAGQYIDITNDEISVNRELIPQIIRYHLDFATSYKCVVTKFEGETQKSQTTYDFKVPNVFTIDDAFTLGCPNWDGWVMTLLKDSTEHSTGYTDTFDPFYYHGTYDESFPSEDLSGYKLVIKSELDAAISSAYHHAGTKTCAELVAGLLVAANEGNVYNMTDSGTTTADFIEGAGQPIKAGDNVGIAKISDGVYKFDLLSGFVDTTNFVQKSQTAGLLKNDGTVNDEIEGDVATLKSGLTNLDSEVNGDAVTYPYADVITIPDAVPANVADCSVKIEPVQDLHGYDKPWVGGAGKNKLPLTIDNLKTLNTTGTWSGNIYTLNSMAFTVLTDDDGNVVGIGVNGQANSDIYFTLINGSIPEGNYKLAGEQSDINTRITMSKNGTIVTNVDSDDSPFEFTSASGDTFIVYIKTIATATYSSAVVRPIIILSTETDATFAPYTNLCPISGHTQSIVTVVDDAESPTVTKTYTIALGDTIYGGTVDFDSGVMTVTKKYIEFSGGETETWTSAGDRPHSFSHAENLGIVDAWSRTDITMISNQFIQNGEVAYYGSNYRIGYTSRGTLYVGMPNIDNVADFKNYLSNNHLQIVGTLATPLTIQLDAKTIQLLKGTNTLYASTGQISVTVNGVSGSIGSVQEQVNELESDKQDKTDNTLQTTEKTIVGGINELKSGLTNMMREVTSGSILDFALTLPTKKTTFISVGNLVTDTPAGAYYVGAVIRSAISDNQLAIILFRPDDTSVYVHSYYGTWRSYWVKFTTTGVTQ